MDEDTYREHGDRTPHGERSSHGDMTGRGGPSALDIENQASKERQEKSREEGKNRRAARKAEKEELAKATSTSERREIREKFDNIQSKIEEGAIFDVTTGELSTNQASLKETIDDDSIDSRGELDDLLTGTVIEVFDVVQSDNTAGTRNFLVSPA